MNADPELDAAIIRHPGIALNHGVLHFDRAAHSFDNAAELDEAPSPVRLTTRPRCTAMVGSIRSLRSARNRAKMRSSSAPAKPAVADHIRDQDRCYFAGLTHVVLPLSSLALLPDQSALSQHRAAKPKKDSSEPLVGRSASDRLQSFETMPAKGQNWRNSPVSIATLNGGIAPHVGDYQQLV